MRDGESPASDGSPATGETSPQPIVDWQPTRGASSAEIPTPVGEATPIRLWQPRDVLIASSLLGFPGGFGIVARNAWRMGRRPTALLYLLAGAVILVLILLLPIPRGLGVALNFGIAGALYALARRQAATVAARGDRVERASGLAGLATFLGGWLVIGGPAFALASAFGAFAPPGNAGTMQFGTSGEACSVDAPRTSVAASGPIHYVAYLSREVKAGETVNLSLSEQVKGHLEDDALAVRSTADCVSGTIPGGTLPAGTYTFTLTVGNERVALGSVVVTP
jgi:hypothetical protein